MLKKRRLAVGLLRCANTLAKENTLTYDSKTRFLPRFEPRQPALEGDR